MTTTPSFSAFTNDRYVTDDGSQTPGAIAFANESRFTAANYSEPLTAFTVGWSDPEDLVNLLNFVAPTVPVGRRFEFKKAINSEAFLSETDDIRSNGAAFKRVDYTGESVNEKTFNKGLTVRVDHDDAVGDDWQERYVQLLLQRLYRNELRRAIAALDAASTNTDKTWNSSSNPDGDLRTILGQASTATGVRPNRLIFGEGAWDIRANAYEGQNTAGAFNGASMSPDQVARRLFAEQGRIIAARYQSSTTAKSAILGDKVYAFYTRDGLMKDEPANIKRFVTPTAGGGYFRVYVDEQSKFTDISVEHYSNVVITSSNGIHKLTISA